MTRKTSLYARKRAQRPDTVAINPLQHANTHISRMRPDEIATVMQRYKRALASAREASLTHTQWVVLCTAAHVAMAIEDGGIIRGQREIIDLADHALYAIEQRCGPSEHMWRSKPCTGPELTALADLVAAHSRQLHELTYREYTEARKRSEARVSSSGGKVFKDLERFL